jgi:hypothetical protein
MLHDRPFSQLTVNLAAVADANHQNGKAAMLDFIDDAVITDTNPESGFAMKLLYARWKWVFGQVVNRDLNAFANRGREVRERLSCGRDELDGVAHS